MKIANTRGANLFITTPFFLNEFWKWQNRIQLNLMRLWGEKAVLLCGNCIPNELREGYRIFWPRAERTSSTPSSAVLLCSSRMGLISTTSMETMDSLSAIISIARCASR